MKEGLSTNYHGKGPEFSIVFPYYLQDISIEMVYTVLQNLYADR